MAINTQFVYTGEKSYIAERNQMVEAQLRRRGIHNSKVIQAMTEMPRHLFISTDQQSAAYDDCPLSLPCNQTISQPYMVAKVAELLELCGDERVLEIGAGCGYQAAILGVLAKEVFASEWFSELAALAQNNLRTIGLDNVTVVHRDGKLGLPEAAPFDRIIVSCSTTEMMPAWYEQLRPGGVIVFPQGPRNHPYDQLLHRWTRGTDGWEKRETIFEVRYVPLL